MAVAVSLPGMLLDFFKNFLKPKVITRFAPSPTGELHIGGARTALFEYLFAKSQGGKFLLRIEDTDRERYIEGSVEHIIEALNWLGIAPDNSGNVMVQSRRLDIYKKYALKLLDENKAYICTCSKEKLAANREKQMAEKRLPRYEKYCRKAGIKLDEVKDKEYVIRMKMPESGKIIVKDLIRGDVETDFSLSDDQVILKSDGYPTYHLASVIDDHEMGITHVIRAEEWLPSTSKHLVLYDMFGWQAPKFAHLPMILAPDKSKLSKRHGATGVFEFKNLGYLPEAMINFIALLGWHPSDDKEILSLKEILNEFSINRVQKGGAIFDIKKLNWLNSQYIKKKNSRDLLELIKKLYGKNVINDGGISLKILEIGKQRMEKLSDFNGIAETFELKGDYETDLLRWKNNSLADVLKNLKKSEEILKILLIHEFNQKKLEQVLMPYADSAGRASPLGGRPDRGEVLWPLRVALSGKEKSPGPFEIMHVIGKEESIRRIDIAIKKIGS